GHGVDPASRKQVLPVRYVDDTVRVRGRRLEPVEILQAAATHPCAERGHRGRRLVRPGQSGHLAAGADELGDDVRAGMARPTRDEYVHVGFLVSDVMREVVLPVRSVEKAGAA